MNPAVKTDLVDQLWDWTLTPREQDVQRSFFVLLQLDKKATFTADDFYAYGLARYFSDPAHMVGAFFRKLAKLNLIEQCGHMHSTRESNNAREVKLWRLKPE